MSFQDLRKRFLLSNISLYWVLLIPFVIQIIGIVCLVGYLFNHGSEAAVDQTANQIFGAIMFVSIGIGLLNARWISHLILRLSKASESIVKVDCNQLEITLIENESRLETFLNNMPAICYIKDLEGKYLNVNREFERVLKISQEEMVGKTDYDFLPIEVADNLRANDRQAILQQSTINI